MYTQSLARTRRSPWNNSVKRNLDPRRKRLKCTDDILELRRPRVLPHVACAADEQPRNSYGALICEKYTETEDFDADAATAYASKMRVQQLREELYLLGVSTRNMLYWDQLVDAYVGALRAGTPRRYGPRRQRHCHCYPSS